MPQKHPNGNRTHSDAGWLVPAVLAWRDTVPSWQCQGDGFGMERTRRQQGREPQDALGQRCRQGGPMHIKRRREHPLQICSVLTSVSSKETPFPRPIRRVLQLQGVNWKRHQGGFGRCSALEEQREQQGAPRGSPAWRGSPDSRLPSPEPSQPPGILPQP